MSVWSWPAATTLRGLAIGQSLMNGLLAVRRGLLAGWHYLRAVSGDDAYERYLEHHASAHAGEPLMTRKEYFAERQRQKWTGVTRCC
jgi:uncharacterized short protein YbdD (DUF466 family)